MKNQYDDIIVNLNLSITLGRKMYLKEQAAARSTKKNQFTMAEYLAELIDADMEKNWRGE